jgi:hypothetical protein
MAAAENEFEAILIVQLPLLGIRQDFVGLGRLWSTVRLRRNGAVTNL